MLQSPAVLLLREEGVLPGEGDPDFIQPVRADGIALPDEVIQGSEGDIDLHPGIMEEYLTVLWELLRGAGEGEELAEHGIRHNDHPFSGEIFQVYHRGGRNTRKENLHGNQKKQCVHAGRACGE